VRGQNSAHRCPSDRPHYGSGVLMGWLSEDSGVTVPAAALPFLLPLVAVILSAVSRDGAPAGTGERGPAGAAV